MIMISRPEITKDTAFDGRKPQMSTSDGKYDNLNFKILSRFKIGLI